MAALTATVTTACLNLFRSGAIGTDVPTVKYVAIGTGTTSPTASDTKLANESTVAGSRIAVNVSNGTNPGEFTASGTLQSSDGVGVAIAEVGFFGGNSATSSVNTGILMARALYAHTKTNNETLTLSLDFTI